MYRDQFGEFVCGYWDLKGLYGHTFYDPFSVCVNRDLTVFHFICWLKYLFLTARVT